MASFPYLAILITQITTSQSLSCTSQTSTKCNIDCDQDETCWNQILHCNTDLDCDISCNGFGNRRRLKHKIQKSTHRNLLSNQCIDNNGCCGSTIYCPSNKNCIIDCSEGCNDVTIHAQYANYLSIENCNTKQKDNQIYCANMTVYCPQNINRETPNPICIINGPVIDSTNIYTQQGFNDLQLMNTKQIMQTQVYCGNSGTEYNCQVNIDGSGCINTDINNDHHTCDNLMLTANPTSTPTIKTVISTKKKLTFYPTMRPTVKTIINDEGRIRMTTTLINIDEGKYDSIFEDEQQQTSSLSMYGMDVQIVILSVVCFFLLMCCMLFCTLWMNKNNTNSKEKDMNNKSQNKNVNINNNINGSDRKIYGQTDDIKLAQANSNKPKIPLSINLDNLSVLSISNFQSTSMRNTSSNGIISPRTQSAIMSICTGHSSVISDWEDDNGLTVEDIDIAFDDVSVNGTVGENPNVKEDEFVIGEGDDEYIDEGGNHTEINNV